MPYGGKLRSPKLHCASFGCCLSWTKSSLGASALRFRRLKSSLGSIPDTLSSVISRPIESKPGSASVGGSFSPPGASGVDLISVISRSLRRPIFLLEGGGTALMASSSAASPYLAAAAMPWLATWACQSVWQAAYSTVPVPQESASKGRRALTLVPCAALLCGGHAAMMAAAGALRRDAGGARSLLGALLVDLPTGLNAGWMAAASGIGLTLAAQTGPKIVQSLATPTGGAALIYGLSSYGAAAAVAFAAPHSLLVSLGYSAATAWACDGISKKENVASRVKSAARHGFWISVAGAIVSLGVAFAKSKK